MNSNNYRTEGVVARTNGRNQAMGTYLTTAGSLMSQGSSAYGSGAFGGGGGTAARAGGGASQNSFIKAGY